MALANTTNDISPHLRYSVLRTSLSKFEKPPYELSSDKLTAVIKQAEKEHRIQTLVLSSKEAQNVLITEESINRAFEEVTNRYDSIDDFYNDLYKNDIDESQFRGSLSRELKVETVLDRVTSQAAEVSDIDVMIYYHMHPDKMKKPEIRKGSHILITISDTIAENYRSLSLEKAKNILEKLKKKPKKFNDYALKYSECPTAYKGGFLGDIKRGVLYKELEDVLFTLGEKQISTIVESPLGFHIMRCDEIQSASTLPLSQVTPAIRQLLETRRKTICQQTWLSKIIAGEKNG